MPPENNQNFNNGASQQPQKSGSGINTILLILLIALIGFGIWFLSEKKETTILEDSTMAKQQEQIVSNELFDWIDTFTVDKDMGSPIIEFIAPEYHLVLLQYPTSQETTSYAVYDYKKNALIKNVGSSYQSGGTVPVAFAGEDKVLVFSLDEKGPDPESSKGVLTVQDFNNKVIKTIIKDVAFEDVYPKYGKELYIRGNNQTYILNTDTLELTN